MTGNRHALLLVFLSLLATPFVRQKSLDLELAATVRAFLLACQGLVDGIVGSGGLMSGRHGVRKRRTRGKPK